jgi:hypothetical protein
MIDDILAEYKLADDEAVIDDLDNDPHFQLALMCVSPEYTVQECYDFAAKHGLEIGKEVG